MALGTSWGRLGGSWGSLGGSCGALGAVLAALGPLLAALGGPLGASWGALGPPKNASGSPSDIKPPFRHLFGRPKVENMLPATTNVQDCLDVSLFFSFLYGFRSVSEVF